MGDGGSITPFNPLPLPLPPKVVCFQLFREPDTQNLKSSDTRFPVNNFVKNT